MNTPLKLAPFPTTALWGGRRLKEKYGKKTDVDPLAETWELSVRPKENSRVSGGGYDGLTLAEALEKSGERVPSPFPLLVKFIDAAKPLSVQVHPDTETAAALGEECAKNEMWYIVEAAPDAEIIYGLADGVTAEGFSRAVLAGENMEPLLRHVPVKAGDVFHVPAGLPHAIGAGVLLAEVQENSDVTYRLYDYDRVDKNGKKRELHTEKALRSIRDFSDEDIMRLRFSRASAMTEDLVADNEFFRVRRLINAAADYPVTRGFLFAVALDGDATCVTKNGTVFLKKGEAAYFSEALSSVSITANGTLLLAETAK